MGGGKAAYEERDGGKDCKPRMETWELRDAGGGRVHGAGKLKKRGAVTLSRSPHHFKEENKK